MCEQDMHIGSAHPRICALSVCVFVCLPLLSVCCALCSAHHVQPLNDLTKPSLPPQLLLYRRVQSTSLSPSLLLSLLLPSLRRSEGGCSSFAFR